MLTNISAIMWIVLCVVVFMRAREWDKAFSKLYDELTKEE